MDDARAGLQSDALRTALKEALTTGRPTRLEELLALHGAVLTPRPNLKLAAAFGAEVAATPDPANQRRVLALLNRLTAEDAAPDDPRAFLPIAAAHGWTACLRAGREQEAAWAGLAELASDERSPVRVGTLDALLAWGMRETGADALLARAQQWLDNEDRERRFGTAALVIEALGDRRLLAKLRHFSDLLDYLTAVMAQVADAPRSAERSDARRRLLAALPRTLAAVVTHTAAGDQGQTWLAAHCQDTTHADLREALSQALVLLRSPAFGASAAVVDQLRRTLEGSGKPPRDPSRIRPGTGRGKASRRIR